MRGTPCMQSICVNSQILIGYMLQFVFMCVCMLVGIFIMEKWRKWFLSDALGPLDPKKEIKVSVSCPNMFIYWLCALCLFFLWDLRRLDVFKHVCFVLLCCRHLLWTTLLTNGTCTMTSWIWTLCMVYVPSPVNTAVTERDNTVFCLLFSLVCNIKQFSLDIHISFLYPPSPSPPPHNPQIRETRYITPQRQIDLTLNTEFKWSQLCDTVFSIGKYRIYRLDQRKVFSLMPWHR